MSRARYRVLEGKKESDFIFSYGHMSASSPFIISIDFELREDSHHSFWRDKISLFDINEASSFRTIIHEFVPTKELADKVASLWTEERLTKFTSKSESYWHIGGAQYMRGWLTPNGRKKWNRKYEKLGRDLAALEMSDSDFVGEITLDWLYFKHLWSIDGESFLTWKCLLNSGVEQKSITDFCFVEDYEYMEHVLCNLKSEHCPKQIKDWFNQLYEQQILYQQQIQEY